MLSSSQVVVLAILASVMAMRVVELRIARRRLRAHSGVPEPERVFPVMVALHSSMFVLVPLEVFGLHRGFSGPVFVVAAAVLAIGTVLRFHVLATLGEHWNVRVIRPTGFVATGVYRHVRHPNYLAVILEIPAICMLHGAWISAIVLSTANGIVLYFRIRKEEAVLATVPGYLEQMGGKPRFIPRCGS